jgi:hypothetical protein
MQLECGATVEGKLMCVGEAATADAGSPAPSNAVREASVMELPGSPKVPAIGR